MGMMTLSGLFIARVHKACTRAAELHGRGTTLANNTFSADALDAYILSVCMLDSFMSEACFTPMLGLLDKHGVSHDLVERLDVRKKYFDIPKLLWGRTYDRGAQPYQDFDLLVEIRNHFVHYRVGPFGTAAKLRRRLASRHLLLDVPIAEMARASLAWPTDALNFRSAVWAHNTACDMIRSFYELAGEDASQPVMAMLAGDYPSISQEESRSMILSAEAANLAGTKSDPG
jgi:hypothetical protein